MDPAVADLNRKIEALTAQVAYLSEQAQLTERQRQDRAELMRDLTPVAEEALRLSVEQLEEIQDYIDLSDLLATVAPLADEAFAKAVDILAEMERKGYFGLARTGMRSLDQMVMSLTEEDVRRMGEGGVSLFSAVKEAAQPETIRILRNILLAAGREIERPVDISYLGLLRQLANPEVRRGLGLMLRMLQVAGAQVPGSRHEVNSAQGANG